MWADVRQRLTAMGINSPTDTRKGIDQLSQQFFGLIVSFDEGLLSHDTVLAAALWWNLFEDKSKLDPLAIAQMVSYVRAQVKHLDAVTSAELFSGPSVKFLPFQQCVLPSQL
jgi:cytochrome b pre-mRNA-processing protein 3